MPGKTLLPLNWSCMGAYWIAFLIQVRNAIVQYLTILWPLKSARGRSCFPWSVNFLGFFLAACNKVFRKASLSLMKEQVSRLAKSAVVQYVTVFRLILAKRVKHWSRAWGIILRALMWAVTSLWPQKVAFRSQNYSARAKLMLISDQARDLVKICFEGRRPCVPFKTARLHPGSWINRLCQQSLHVMIYVEKARVIERE